MSEVVDIIQYLRDIEKESLQDECDHSSVVVKETEWVESGRTRYIRFTTTCGICKAEL